MGKWIGKAAGTIGLVLASLLAPVGPAGAVPASLRGVEDVEDFGALFMRAESAGNVSGAWRALAEFWPLPPSVLGARIVEAEKRRAARRLRLGLSIGWEAIATERAGERVLRLTYFERFDRGGVVWQLTFFKPENAWLVEEVSDSEDLGLLFGDEPGDAASGASAAPAPPAPPAPDDASGPSDAPVASDPAGD